MRALRHLMSAEHTKRLAGVASLGAFCLIAAGALSVDLGFEWPLAIAQKLSGGPWLVSYDRLPEEGDACEYEPVSETLAAAGTLPLRSALLQARVAQSASEEVSQRKPLRMIRDPYAAYSAV